MITIKKTSTLTLKEHEMQMNMSQREYEHRMYLWLHKKMPLEEAFDNLNVDEIEFLRTGMTPEEWEAYITQARK